MELPGTDSVRLNPDAAGTQPGGTFSLHGDVCFSSVCLLLVSRPVGLQKTLTNSADRA